MSEHYSCNGCLLQLLYACLISHCCLKCLMFCSACLQRKYYHHKPHKQFTFVIPSLKLCLVNFFKLLCIIKHVACLLLHLVGPHFARKKSGRAKLCLTQDQSFSVCLVKKVMAILLCLCKYCKSQSFWDIF